MLRSLPRFEVARVAYAEEDHRARISGVGAAPRAVRPRQLGRLGIEGVHSVLVPRRIEERGCDAVRGGGEGQAHGWQRAVRERLEVASPARGIRGTEGATLGPA